MSRYKKLAVTGRYTVDNVKIVWPTSLSLSSSSANFCVEARERMRMHQKPNLARIWPCVCVGRSITGPPLAQPPSTATGSHRECSFFSTLSVQLHVTSTIVWTPHDKPRTEHHARTDTDTGGARVVSGAHQGCAAGLHRRIGPTRTREASRGTRCIAEARESRPRTSTEQGPKD